LSSLGKMLGIMELFTDEKFAWTIEEMEGRLELTRSTLYRYLRELMDAELLTALPQVGYTLGPKIIELESLVQRRDPLIVASRPLMAELVATFGGLSALCRSYRHKVLCVHQELGLGGFTSGYLKGRSTPLLLGSASRVILAHFPPAVISRLVADHAEAFERAGLGASLGAVRESLRDIRQKGWDVTVAQVTAGVTGIAAPLFDAQGLIVGSLSVVVRQTDLPADLMATIVDKTTFSARTITRMMKGPVEPKSANVRPGRYRNAQIA
jgi:DNA-binding IclR family transcriptional regulator